MRFFGIWQFLPAPWPIGTRCLRHSAGRTTSLPGSDAASCLGPRNFKAKREETRSMVGPVDEAIAILLDSKPNGDQRPISPPYAWEVDENPFPIGYPLPSLKIVRGFGFCQCLSISCCGLGCQEVSPRGASRRGSSMNASFIQTSCTIPFPPTLAI